VGCKKKSVLGEETEESHHRKRSLAEIKRANPKKLVGHIIAIIHIVGAHMWMIGIPVASEVQGGGSHLQCIRRRDGVPGRGGGSGGGRGEGGRGLLEDLGESGGAAQGGPDLGAEQTQLLGGQRALGSAERNGVL